MKSLSPEKIAEFKCAFELFDRNNEGKISHKEIGTIIEKLGQSLSDEDLKEMIKEVDIDGDGCIDFEEFLTLMCSKLRDNDSEEEMMEAFKVFDKDGDGFIGKNDFKNVMSHLGEPLINQEVDEIITDWDEDGDDQLSYKEFKNMMTFK